MLLSFVDVVDTWKKVSKMAKTKYSEKALEARLVRGVARLGGRALKFASATETGYPDRLVLLPGGFAEWVELKSSGKKPTLLQHIRHCELRKMGFRVTVVSTGPELDCYLDELGEELSE